MDKEEVANQMEKKKVEENGSTSTSIVKILSHLEGVVEEVGEEE